jgi:hypothetical protein
MTPSIPCDRPCPHAASVHPSRDVGACISSKTPSITWHDAIDPTRSTWPSRHLGRPFPRYRRPHPHRGPYRSRGMSPSIAGDPLPRYAPSVHSCRGIDSPLPRHRYTLAAASVHPCRGIGTPLPRHRYTLAAASVHPSRRRPPSVAVKGHIGRRQGSHRAPSRAIWVAVKGSPFCARSAHPSGSAGPPRIAKGACPGAQCVFPSARRRHAQAKRPVVLALFAVANDARKATRKRRC